jgi:hypothetical protein
MTRGKYAQRSENRRDRESLAAAARDAEHAAARQATQSAQTIEALKRQIDSLAADLDAAKKLMVEQSSPEVRRLKSEVEGQRATVDELRRDLAVLNKCFRRFDRVLANALARNFNLSKREARSLVLEVWLSTVGRDLEAMNRLYSLKGGPPKPESVARAFDKGRITAEQADGIIAAREKDLRLGKVPKAGDVVGRYGPQWTSDGDTFGAWLVCFGEERSPTVVAIYDNKAAAERHAETGTDLRVDFWNLLEEFDATAVAA